MRNVPTDADRKRYASLMGRSRVFCPPVPQIVFDPLLLARTIVPIQSIIPAGAWVCVDVEASSHGLDLTTGQFSALTSISVIWRSEPNELGDFAEVRTKCQSSALDLSSAYAEARSAALRGISLEDLLAEVAARSDARGINWFVGRSTAELHAEIERRRHAGQGGDGLVWTETEWKVFGEEWLRVADVIGGYLRDGYRLTANAKTSRNGACLLFEKEGAE